MRLLGDAARVIHTGQHYDNNLSGQFLRRAGPRRARLPARRRRAHAAAARSARPPPQLEAHFHADPPAVIVVHGDTNATVAGALAANALSFPLVHVEAGLRSFDRAMPEEHNRVVADHLADLCLAPTEINRANLAAEGIGGDKVILTGNTVVDAVLDLLPSPTERAAVLARHGVEPAGFVLATFHRPENVDDPETLAVILDELGRLDLPVILPLHPRTRAKIDDFGLEDAARAAAHHRADGLPRVPGHGGRVRALLVSDSGGVQEEASIVKRPVRRGAQVHRAARDPRARSPSSCRPAR